MRGYALTCRVVCSLSLSQVYPTEGENETIMISTSSPYSTLHSWCFDARADVRLGFLFLAQLQEHRDEC